MNQSEFRKWLFENASIRELLRLLWWKLTNSKKIEIFIKSYHDGCNFYACMRYAKTK